ncbi:hypothetical protein VNI00_005726 [Paramarasmius palmivorus]|uniref:Leucine-rich repeat-containing protein n=1 Tax=Paramarasmius palmivorus TaxID=297713 RepID=A0AAW0DEF6_9AGAR
MSFMSYDSPPPSSPASSPSPYVDSSPPSSPGSSFIGTSFNESPGPQDPYAASAKAIRQPRLYEKKRPRSISPTPEAPARNAKAPRALSPAPAWEDSTIDHRSEEDIWNDAITRVFDLCHGKVDLEAQGLNKIPPNIIDLADFWVTEGYNAARSTSQPQYTEGASTRRAFSRSKSLAEYSGFPRDRIQLLLALNHIAVIPQELFHLKNLTVLSLRGNKLTYLPPEITQLTSLTNLNVASNKITFLPSEIMALKLDQLQIHPNPFLPLPSSTRLSRTLSRSRSRAKSSEPPPPKPCSPTIHVFERVVPLFELCLRALIAESPTHPQHSVLQDVYELPLSEHPAPIFIPKGKRRFTQQLPPLIHDILDAVLPGSVYEDADDSPNSPQASRLSMSLSQTTFSDFETWLKLRKDALASPSTEYHLVTGKGVCPSPRHEGESPAVFVVHAEERFTWEHTVAGVPNLGDVPIRWRGCQKGCLDYLDGKQKGAPEIQLTQDFSAAPKPDDDAGAVDLVQPVEFTAGSFTLDDFNDG